MVEIFTIEGPVISGTRSVLSTLTDAGWITPGGEAPKAFLGGDGISVTSGTSCITLVNTKPNEIDVDGITVSGGAAVTGTINIVGSRAVNVSLAGSTITIDAPVATAGGGQQGGGSGDFLADGTVAMSGPFQAATGNAGAPSITFDSDTAENTGFYLKSENVLGLSSNGVEIAALSGTGLGIVGNLVAARGDFSTGLSVSGLSVSLRSSVERVHFAVAGITAANYTWTNMPTAVTLLFGSAAGVQLVDTRCFSAVRLLAVKMGTAGAAASRLRLRYHTAFTTTAATYVDISTTGSPEVALNTTNTMLNSGWQTLLPAAKREDCYLAVVGSGGDAALDPILGTIVAEFK